MMGNLRIQIIIIIVSAICFAGVKASFVQAQTQAQTQTQSQIQAPANRVCKTGSDADLPEIKTKIAKMADELKRLKQAKQTALVNTSTLRGDIVAIDQGLGPWRVRHKVAAELAGSSAEAYATYKAEWIDAGELERLNANINLRKVKHQDYKLVLAQYQAVKTQFETLGAKYQHIARDLLDRDRDCDAAKTALH